MNAGIDWANYAPKKDEKNEKYVKDEKNKDKCWYFNGKYLGKYISSVHSGPNQIHSVTDMTFENGTIIDADGLNEYTEVDCNAKSKSGAVSHYFES